MTPGKSMNGEKLREYTFRVDDDHENDVVVRVTHEPCQTSSMSPLNDVADALTWCLDHLCPEDDT